MRVSVFYQSLDSATSQRALLGLFCFYLYGKVPKMTSEVVPVKYGNKNIEAKNEWHCSELDCCSDHWNKLFILFKII